jgi:NAD(P)-dependent dehydrogenase (short-subunit alcohol dehydrogenase family)
MSDDVKRPVAARIPLGRFGKTEEFAGAVTLLLSPAAACINGAVLRLDEGFGLFPW